MNAALIYGRGVFTSAGQDLLSSHCGQGMPGPNRRMSMNEDRWGRVARVSLWALLALSIPYALLMIATGIFFGLWNAPDPVLTIVWGFIVTSPIWLTLLIVLSRGSPRKSVAAAICSWLAAALLLLYIYR